MFTFHLALSVYSFGFSNKWGQHFLTVSDIKNPYKN